MENWRARGKGKWRNGSRDKNVAISKRSTNSYTKGLRVSRGIAIPAKNIFPLIILQIDHVDQSISYWAFLILKED